PERARWRWLARRALSGLGNYRHRRYPGLRPGLSWRGPSGLGTEVMRRTGSSIVAAVNLLEALFLRLHAPMSFTAGLDSLALEHASFVVVDVIGGRTKDGAEAAIDDVVDGRFGEPFARRGATRA